MSDIELETRLKRRGEALQFLQLVAHTFVSLTLTERNAICDTLTALVATFLEARHGATLLLDRAAGRLVVAARQGEIASDALTGDAAQAFWRGILHEKRSGFVDGPEVRSRWAGAPPQLADGFACAVIDIRDEAIGVILVSTRSSREPFREEEIEFLTTAAGLGAMALTSAEALAAREDLVRDVERRADEARQEASQKEQALREIDDKLEIIDRQRSAIRELSTPILHIWDDTLALPVIGVVDSRRSADIMERLLTEITVRRSRFVILDITGVEVVDTKTADHFIRVVKAVELLGSCCIITGMRPAVAQTLVGIGVDLSGIVTMQTLRDGLRECFRRIRSPEEGIE